MYARRLIGLVAIAALGTAACGRDAGQETPAPPSPTPTAAAAPTPTATAGARIEIAGLPGIYHGTEDVTDSGQVTIDMAGGHFEPTVIRGTPGQEVAITLRNTGESPHHFTTADQQLIVEVQPGLTAEGEITLPQSGNLSFYCLLHHEEGMAGGFNVSGPIEAPDPHATPTHHSD